MGNDLSLSIQPSAALKTALANGLNLRCSILGTAAGMAAFSSWAKSLMVMPLLPIFVTAHSGGPSVPASQYKIDCHYINPVERLHLTDNKKSRTLEFI